MHGAREIICTDTPGHCRHETDLTGRFDTVGCNTVVQ
jgi:hypothetical protein